MMVLSIYYLFLGIYFACFLVVFYKSIIVPEKCNTSVFPSTFQFGAGSAAYQVEGAWNQDGKSPSFWDWLTNSYFPFNGNTADDSYHKYKEDIAAMQTIGLNFYRFSLSWTRLLPKGFNSEINQAGVDYYNNLIDGLIAAGIEPVVTIFHWDTPLAFHYLGDWTNDKIVDYFVEFADKVFQLFGDRVKLWATINEPKSFCQLIPTLLQSHFFPEIPIGTYEYLCGHNVILAHAKTYRLYQAKYKASQGGKLGIVLNGGQNVPLTNSTEDKDAAERAYAFDIGWFAHPLWYGDYPQIMKEVIASNSKNQNFSSSRLPVFSIKDKVLIQGAFDVFMINSYGSTVVTMSSYNNTPSYVNDKQITDSNRSNWTLSNIGFVVYPEGMRGFLKYIKETYQNPQIVITENGYSDSGGLNDNNRIQFIKEYLYQIRLAICEDDVRVTHYTYWSILDSFEWSSAYRAKFGLVQVDFNSTNLTRTLKQSAYFYKNLIQTRLLNVTST